MLEGTRYGPQTHPQFDVREPDAYDPPTCEGARYGPPGHICGTVRKPDAYAPTMDGKIKAPPPARRMGLVGLEIFGIRHTGPAGALAANTKIFNAPSAIPDRRVHSRQ
jgi:hypothetical protein